ncbi:MAG TPA: nitroreductase family protein, partial [Geomobilimonas sp.]|nr:nitroreductase family protein [Geomobilimonas sp.]
MEAVFSLKSVREFSPQGVPESLIRDILKEVMHMPVTGSHRPWQFVVINDRSVLGRIPGFLSSA